MLSIFSFRILHRTDPPGNPQETISHFIIAKFTKMLFVYPFQLMNVQVPFLFKYAVDFLNDTPLVISDAETAMVSMATIFILGCKSHHN